MFIFHKKNSIIIDELQKRREHYVKYKKRSSNKRIF